MSPRDLERSGKEAAREARALLAALVEQLEDDPLSSSLTPIVGTLFAAELADARALHGVLDDAMRSVRALLDGQAAQTRPLAAQALSRAMAQLHPARAVLARSLGLGTQREGTAPFLLTSSRVKPSAPPEGEPEQRDASRMELEVPIGLEGDNRFYTGTTDDLSRGGLFVATDDPLQVGTELRLSFVLPDGYRVSARAEVAWVRVPRYRPHELPAGMGIRFDRLSGEDERAIAHYLEERPAFHYGD